jgi:hypothetical protein
MNYDIFDENYYLTQYSFVKDAISTGLVKSGLDHFQKYGQKLGYTEVSRYFNESYYLSSYPEVAAAVKARVFASGLDHFIQDGYDGGRTLVSSDYDEAFYLKRHPELAQFLQNGTFKSGLQHFIKYGIKEGKYATSFFEPEYLLKNPGVAAAVKAGIFKTGGEHYRQYGQFESTRSATFVGTSGNDLVTGFGIGKIELIGVQVALDAKGNRIYESTGDREEDTFIGTKGSDTFVLGNSLRNFYRANFGLTQALIKNFDPNADLVELFGKRRNFLVSNSRFGNNLIIFNFPSIDPINTSNGTIEGGGGFSDVRNKFIFNQDKPLIRNFLESQYLDTNPDVAAALKVETFTSGLDHYTKFGQFEANRLSFFAGTNGNDIVTAFGNGKTLITGVELDTINNGFNPGFESDGSNEFDTLIGSEGSDTFVLGLVSSLSRSFIGSTLRFYEGSGLARIQGFNQSQGDQLQLVSGQNGINDYQISPEGADLVISVGQDRIAILEGGASLTLRQLSPSPTIGSSTILVG